MWAPLASLALLPGTLALVGSPGDTAVIPGWHLQSSLHAPNNLSQLSLPNADVSKWYRIGSRATVFAGLLENSVHNDSHLWYSNNMESVDQTIFRSPWLYREEMTIQSPPKGQHVFLVTHGIGSKADIFFNGVQVASNKFQQGSYGGHRYDITSHLHSGANALLIQAYPTNYLRDFAQGFVDWNPYPPDNGTGVWRNVELKQTGPVSLSAPRVVTDFKDTDAKEATITIKADIENHEGAAATGLVHGVIQSPDGSQSIQLSQKFQLGPDQNTTVSIAVPVSNPQIWWPAAWGQQPLYTVSLNLSLSDGQVSDSAAPTRFGIRKVTSKVNAHNDTAFTVNGHAFQVRGGGYGPDMFLRFDIERVKTIFQYMLDMGLNTVRLEGKQEHPELYELADRVGLMVIAGWECCDKWEGWEYNDEAAGEKWTEKDYPIARAAMLHEAEMMQAHPSMLAFLVGSDFWPNDRATAIYVDALNRMDWPNPVIASASKRGYPKQLGPSGMKMDGPYDWVPPNYWYHDEQGAAFGFGSEEGAGVGTPELSSMRQFMSPQDLESLWKKPNQNQYHMSRYDSSFYNRKLYNKALFGRYGKPTGLEDYVRKAQMMDYEATRAEFEGFATRQNASRPATGVVYWMLNSAWPNLHWQLFDYYLRPAGSYFGTKVGARLEHVAFDYSEDTVYLISHAVQGTGKRIVSVDLIDSKGKSISHDEVTVDTAPNASKLVAKLAGRDKIQQVGFLRLVLKDAQSGNILSRNVYWLSAKNDVLDWKQSNWYTTPVTKYADLSAVSSVTPASVKASIKPTTAGKHGMRHMEVTLENQSDVPAVFLHLSVIDPDTKQEISPVYWSDNYVSLYPKEKLTLTVDVAQYKGVISLEGNNVKSVILGGN
ncbi:putative glycosyl hydrolase [Aspergillus tanneri]|nr:uncharacterized protein ATNIH1004_011504 [Aspergillus tanneri]KAA8642559.1 hypothetical protein ATNIH1004_011504 [Aspergillus tanneri]